MPAVLGRHYRLEKAIVPQGEVTGWWGGLYNGPGGRLLCICKEPPAESLPQLLSEVELEFKVSLNVLSSDEQKLTVVDESGNSGLLVRDDLHDQLLLVVEGEFTEPELWSILTQ